MTGSLIINARDRLRWHQRLGSDVSTLVLWGVWLRLWYPVLRTLAFATTELGVHHRVVGIGHLSGASAVGLPRYAMALVGMSGSLLLWNRLPALKVCTPELRSVGDYARHFELPEEEILGGRSARVCVVHHDAGGRIVRVERSLKPEGPAPT